VPEIENVSAKRAGLRPFEPDGPPSTCRLCGNTDLTLFIHIPRVAPSGQFIALSREEPVPEPVAMSVWRCTHCELVQHNGGYPEGYYDSYFISYRTSDFARNYQGDLAREFVSDYELQSKLVAEIGCGDGMFLSLMRDAGAEVIGFERSHRSAETLRADGYTIIESTLAEALDSIPQPLAGVATRHVLEHIDDLDTFLGEIRQALLPGGAVLIEVPAFEQTLEGRRVFDFTPEHVSYFSTSTLGLALERAGFRSIRLRRIIDGEFLVATAVTPTDELPPNEWLSSIADDFNAFIREQEAKGDTVALWGAGPKGLGLISETAGLGVRYVVDSDPLKHGRFTPTPRLPIISPEQFMEDPTSVVVIAVMVYRDEIIQQLRDLGYQGEVKYLGPSGEILSLN
jgi:SAM-dependent methyltransferase